MTSEEFVGDSVGTIVGDSAVVSLLGGDIVGGTVDVSVVVELLVSSSMPDSASM